MNAVPGLRAEGKTVSVSAVCRWLGVARSTAYYLARQRKAPPIDGLVANVIYEII